MAVLFFCTERRIEQMNFKERAKQLKSDIPAIFLAFKDKDTPIIAKILAAVTVAYALSPIDLIPDFIPVLGYLDDLIVLPALAALTIKLIPKEKFEECRIKAEGLWEKSPMCSKNSEPLSNARFCIAANRSGASVLYHAG